MASTNIFDEIASLTRRGESAILATVVNSTGSAPRKPGARMLIRRDGSFTGTVGGGVVEQKVCEAAPEILVSGQPRLMRLDLLGQAESLSICGGVVEVFVEPLLPPETIYLVGAGHVGQAVASIGKLLGFRVVVIDPRSEFNNAVRFPSADTLTIESYAEGLRKAPIGQSSYIIILTPAHTTDEACLETVVRSGARYVGMIGSKKKSREIKEHLLAKGVPQADIDKVHSPIGLDINSETPEEIAVSIMAEVVKVRREAP